uniref:4-nitrophenylphosphatase n=1 Tax=Timema tahoe TaxID=61484 RepID=A0A7R9NZI8_9NEOP|nr:unnamed protein product [Timema tahoe]
MLRTSVPGVISTKAKHLILKQTHSEIRKLALLKSFSPQSNHHTDNQGVLWFPGKGPIAGSPQAIARLVELGKTVFLLTNNSMASIDRYHGVCQNLGMPVPKAAPPNLSTAWTAPQSMFSNPPVTSSPLYSAPMRTPLSIGSLDASLSPPSPYLPLQLTLPGLPHVPPRLTLPGHSYVPPWLTLPENIITTAVSTLSYLKEHNFSKKAFVVGSVAFVEHLEKSGIKCVRAPNHIEEDVESILQALRNLDPEVGAVILDVDPNMNFIKMSIACQYLKIKTDCLFIIGATEEVVNIDEFSLFGPCIFNELIVKNSERNAFTVGKPGVYVKDVINKIHLITPQRTLMIGDMLAQDVQLGTKCGFQTLFVLSGLDKLEDATNELYMPNYYINTLGDLLPLL